MIRTAVILILSSPVYKAGDPYYIFIVSKLIENMISDLGLPYPQDYLEKYVKEKPLNRAVFKHLRSCTNAIDGEKWIR